MYICFVVQQMYVSLTYPFNIVHTHYDTLLNTASWTVWSPRQHCMINCDVMLDNNVRQFDPSHKSTKNLKRNITNAKMKELTTALAFFELKKRE